MSNRITLDQLPKRYQDQVAQEIARHPSRKPANGQPIPEPPPASQKPATAIPEGKARLTESHEIPHNRSVVSNAQSQRHQTAALDGADAGKAQGDARTHVRFVGFRVRPLDPDNFAGSVKDLLDGLRHAGLISGDEPWRIILETEQVKVATFAEERTEITLICP